MAFDFSITKNIPTIDVFLVGFIKGLGARRS